MPMNLPISDGFMLRCPNAHTDVTPRWCRLRHRRFAAQCGACTPPPEPPPVVEPPPPVVDAGRGCHNCGNHLTPNTIGYLCRRCYVTLYKRMSRQLATAPSVTCQQCGQFLPHEAKGLCRQCYARARKENLRARSAQEAD